MSSDRTTVTEDDLHAWVDGQLPPDRIDVVERWLAENPSEAERFERYRQHRLVLRDLMQPKFEEPVPPQLTGALQPANRRHLPWRQLAAGIVLLLVGGAAGWSLPHPGAAVVRGSLTAEAVQAHVVFVKDARHPVEVAADQEAHLVTWLSNRLGRKLSVPDLSQFGFHLIGGRLLPGSGQPAAQFMFENQTALRLTLYVHGQSTGGAGFDVIQRDGVAGFRWFEDGLMYVILANTSRTDLLTIAETVDRQLSPAPAR